MSNAPWRSVSVDVDPDPKPSEEVESFRSQADKLSLHKAHLENTQFEIDIKERRRFAERAYWMATIWLGFVVVLTALQFFGRPQFTGLETPSFLAVIGTTTVSVLGFWLLVGRYLFRQT